MRPIILTTSGVSTSGLAVPNIHAPDFVVSLALKVTGTVTATVQYTFDDPFDAAFTPAGAVWFSHSGMTGVSANTDHNFAYPVRAIRVNQTVGTGSTILVVTQAGTVS